MAYNQNYKTGFGAGKYRKAFRAGYNLEYAPRGSGGGNGPQKITSGAKRAKVDKGFGISAWKKMGRNFFTFFANVEEGKHLKKVKGTNGKEYHASIAVKVFNKTTLAESWAWGLWAPHANTLTIAELGLYITLKNGGFVGKIKA